MMFRSQRGGGRGVVLGAAIIASCLAVLGSSLNAVAGGTPSPSRIGKWQQAIESAGLPGKGCFTASFPRVEWRKTPCKAAPDLPYPPTRGIASQTVGNGVDYSAEVSGHLTSATGSFDFVTPGATETGQQNGVGPQVANTFSLQLNTKPFTSPECSGSPNPGCLGWQQFIYSTTYNQVFIQYWLLKYNTTCPGGWTSFMFPPPSTDVYCFMNSTGGTLTGG